MDSETSGGETPSSKPAGKPSSPGGPGSKRSAAPRTTSPKTTSPKTTSPKTTSPKAAPKAATTRKSTNTDGVPKRRRTRSADDPAPDDDGTPAGAAPWPDRPRPWRGRLRNGDLYNRSVQRANEQRPMVARLLARPLGRPELILRLLGETDRVERDGRVLHPALQAALAVANRLNGGRTPSTPAEMPSPFVLRRQLRNSARAVMPVRTDVYVSGRVIAGPEQAPRLGIRIYRQFGAGLGIGVGRGRPLPAIVYFHGGGWVAGDLDSHDALCRILAVASRCQVVAVDYRLAPEFPFPAAVDDALAAYTWVHEHVDELGVDPGRIGVMGDSAGATLAAVVAQVTRAGAGQASSSVSRRGAGHTSNSAIPPPVAQGLVYPVVDARLGFESMRSFAEGFLLTRTEMEYFRDHYLPDRSDWENPLASPLLAADLGGLAPALVVSAGFDPLRDDAVTYAEALRRAGVVVEERRYDDQIHGFMLMGVVPDSLAMATEVCESMGRLMRRSATVDGAEAEDLSRSPGRPDR